MYRIRDWLLIGNYPESMQRAALNAYGITALLQLAAVVQHPGLAVKCIVVDDGAPLAAERLREGVDFVRARKAEGRKVLVACGAGISRSVSFAIAALKEEEGLSLLDAYAAVRAAHPAALPHPALWESLRQYYGEPTTYLMMTDALLLGKKSDD